MEKIEIVGNTLEQTKENNMNNPGNDDAELSNALASLLGDITITQEPARKTVISPAPVAAPTPRPRKKSKKQIGSHSITSMIKDGDYYPYGLTVAAYKELPVKVREKLYNAWSHVFNGTKLSTYTESALYFIKERGECNNIDLMKMYIRGGYSEKTARSQGNQIVGVLAALGAATYTGPRAIKYSPMSLFVKHFDNDTRTTDVWTRLQVNYCPVTVPPAPVVKPTPVAAPAPTVQVKAPEPEVNKGGTVGYDAEVNDLAVDMILAQLAD